MGDDDEAIRIAHLQKTPVCRRLSHSKAWTNVRDISAKLLTSGPMLPHDGQAESRARGERRQALGAKRPVAESDGMSSSNTWPDSDAGSHGVGSWCWCAELDRLFGSTGPGSRKAVQYLQQKATPTVHYWNRCSAEGGAELQEARW